MKALKIVLLLAVAIVVTGMVLTRVPAVQDAMLEAAIPRVLGRDFGESENLRFYICGSASPAGNSPDRAQACIALVTPEHFYLFDAGAGSGANLMADGLPMQRLDGIFLTHFHSDHIADLPAMRLNSWVNGRSNPLKVFGPNGVEEVVAGFNMAYRFDNEHRTAHHGEELLPAEMGLLVPETSELGVVLEDEGLKVTMFTVVHDPIEPAVGYMIEYRGRKVVISGDTIVVDELFELAEGADLLFHDALSRTALLPMIDGAKAAGRDRLSIILHDVLDYHADIAKLQQASEAADVKQLVLYHMVPTPTNVMLEWMWQRDLTGNTIMSDDRMVFELTPAD